MRNTTIFLLPLLFKEDTKYSDIRIDSYEDAYIADIDDPSKNGFILIEYKGELPAKLNELSLLSPDHFYVKDNSTICAYRLHEEFTEDYDKFLYGKYSKFSEQAKKKILTFWMKSSDSFLHGILYKTWKAEDFWIKKFKSDPKKWTAEAEYWPPPNKKKETLGYEIVYYSKEGYSVLYDGY